MLSSNLLHSVFSRVLASAFVVLTLVTVATCCWTASQFWSEYLADKDQKNIDRLNQMVHAYKERAGKMPDLNLVDLYHQGLSERRLHETPFGGYYRLDPHQAMVYNPNR
jgi:hypothetical protein